MRLFVALDIDDEIREKISSFVGQVREFAPEARWVRPESLHVTLKFIGEKPEQEVEKIKLALGTIESKQIPCHSDPQVEPGAEESLPFFSNGKIEMSIRGYGFFPTARAPRVFWIGITSDSSLSSLAAAVDEKLSAIGIPKEDHAFNPHLTLARGAGGSGSPRQRKGDHPNRRFECLQEKLSALPTPEFGSMMAREYFLYQSRLSPGGSIYTKLAAFPLR
ncbi:MAG TPA: RNA 2',3'-cyclic phosphodiesterase [Candidatus Aquilonibacter sp.]|jgi:2'-5' RNA ligase|nr:RNA 2',3'-cyclic phosphodiesterase [Candidatus Aquilonibacter sp.]